jgi:outer membrane protein assembly factor BamB
VYAITSPTSVSELSISPLYTANANTASSEGHFFLGSKLPSLTSLLVVHVDAANSRIVWEVPVSSVIPTLASATAPHLAAVPGKLFVKFATTDGEQIFSVDTVTQAIGPLVKLEMNPGTGPMITDGTGLYVFDAGKQILYELDQSTFSAKRNLPLKGGDADNTFIDNALAAAGGIWLGRNCGGKIYNRRVDIQAFTVADFEYKQAQAQAPQGYAYLSP